MALEIKAVQSHRDFFDFLHLPGAIYRDEPYSPPPLPLEILSRLRYRLFLARENGLPVGRVAAIVDPFAKETDTGFFGAFEISGRQPDVARKLLENAENWLAAQKIKKIVGPATFNTNQQVGLLIEGFDQPPTPSIPYNPPFYQELLEGAGFYKFTDLLSFHFSLKQRIPPVFDRSAARAARRKGLVLRSLNALTWRQDVQTITLILNRGMADNWGYVPLSFRETHSLVNYCFTKGDPSLVLIVTLEKKPAAFSLCLPAGPECPFPRMAFLVVIPEFRASGLESLLIKKTVEILQLRNCPAVEASQVDENNPAMLKIIQRLQFSLVKRHRVYAKTIAAPV
ncbi:MAG: GNAT family N-acetyltransferase [Armatimonadetes bacterium]|nr:GNAT family N-acetyltransferase [Armatimonadota bacterium]